MSENWYCNVVGQEVGPLTRDELSEMLDQGQISVDDRIRSAEHTAWQRLSRVFPEMAARPADDRIWFFRSFGDEFGPYTHTELKEFVAQEQLAASDDVREGKTGSWKQARLVTGLFSEGENMLADFDSLESAPERPQPKPNHPADHPPARKQAVAAATAAVERPATPIETASPPKAEVSSPERPATPVEVPPPEPSRAPDRSPSPLAEADTVTAATSTPASPPPRPPVAPPPAYTPPPTHRSSGGGGFDVPAWLSSGTTIGIAVGLIVLLGGGWFLITSNVMASFNADDVYKDVVSLYAEFKTASQDGRTSPAFTAFYDKFKDQQFELYEAIGQPAPDTSAFEVKHALQYLGSVIEGFNREQTTEEAQQKYVEALEKQLKKLEPEYGG